MAVAFVCTSASAGSMPAATGRVFTKSTKHTGTLRIALTFDDGPDSRYTPQILDILADHGAHATFFVLGRPASDGKGLLGRMLAEGNEVGNHSWRHPNLSRVSADRVTREIAKTDRVIREAIDMEPRWFRPPYGAANAHVLSSARAAGYDVALWSVDPRDWTRPGGDAIATRVGGKAFDGAIVLMHDGGGFREGTVAAVRKLVPLLQKRGFELVTLSELVYGASPVPAPPVVCVRVRSQGPASLDDGTRIGLATGAALTINGAPVRCRGAPVLESDVAVLPPAKLLASLGVRWTAPGASNELALSSREPVRVEVRDERTASGGGPQASPGLGGACDQAAVAGSRGGRGPEVVGVLNRRETEDSLPPDETD